MKFAYADPPYPGMAHRYKADPNAKEVNHRVLIGTLINDYPDGWALSTHNRGLRELLPLCPDDVRVAAWCKSFAVFRPGINPAYAWEPVLFRGGRKRDRTVATVRDWHVEPITMKRGLVGAKPPQFNLWILDLLGFQRGDTLDDLFPGTNGMHYAVRAREELGV